MQLTSIDGKFSHQAYLNVLSYDFPCLSVTRMTSTVYGFTFDNLNACRQQNRLQIFEVLVFFEI